MHPAYSVIVFTTLSGAGYGLLACMAALALAGAIPPEPVFGLVSLGLAFAMIAGGLLSSTAHLGRPERAWRAFSQWRTSWLSREGVLSLATFVPAGLFAIDWIFTGPTAGLSELLAVASIAGALATVYCTGMIYQSLPTIRAWHQSVVSPIYVVLALASGAVLAVLMLHIFGVEAPAFTLLAAAFLALAAIMKRAYWHAIDGEPRTYTAGHATGLGRFGKVRPLDPPHTQPNYVMREMGFEIGRRHAAKLRRIALAAGFIVPALLLVLTLFAPPTLAIVLATVAVLLCAVGIFTERWLFFAEAQHVVTLYYGAQSA